MTPRTPITGEEVADVLERAADLIDPEGKWTQGSCAKNTRGLPTEVESDEAACFCAAGAIWRITTKENYELAFRAIDTLRDDVLQVTGVGSWNDAEERTQAEVVAALRSAATAARQQGEGK